MRGGFHLRLPATSANLGPAFDTAAVALSLHLDVTAERADEFSIIAEGRDAEACGRLEGNLIVETYRKILAGDNRAAMPLRLEIGNEIPLGMGCGSSAAARLAGIALAIHFGRLDWSPDHVVDVATALEGHPDNVSACWFGGMTVSAVSLPGSVNAVGKTLDRRAASSPVRVARFGVPSHWRPVIVLPRESVRTEESRKLLPSHYSRADIVANLQHTALLVAAFGSGDSSLLRGAMRDRIHQSYRSAICPLLGELEPLVEEKGVVGVALSGAGPGVLLIVEQSLETQAVKFLVDAKLGGRHLIELISCCFETAGAGKSVELSYLVK